MTLPRAIELQKAVFEALFSGLEPIPVSSTPMGLDRYVRVDGFTLVNDNAFRNYERATHRFLIHAFDSPEAGTDSKLWVLGALMQADAILTQVALANASRIEIEDAQDTFTPRGDGKHDAHAFARYNITIGDL